MTCNIHNGDVGTMLIVQIVDCFGTIVNIAAATLMELTFQRPDGTKFVRIPVFTTDGTDGKMQYQLIVGDINQAGSWKRQWHVKTPAGEWYTDILSFLVEVNL